MDTAMKITQHNGIYEQLRKKIISMELKPGERLSESLLSEQLNAGRSVIREVLARLAEEGYVVVYPQRGTEVTLIDRERVKQAVFSHTVLEQSVVGEVCRKGLEEEQIRCLEDTVERQTSYDSENGLEFLETEQELHSILSRLAGKDCIWEVFRTLDCDFLRVKYLQYMTYNYTYYMSPFHGWERVVAEMRLLVDNIRRKNAEAAKLLCSNSFDSVLLNADSLSGIYPQYFK